MSTVDETKKAAGALSVSEREELCDAHALMLARLANAGKKGMTLKESRAKRGLPPL